jgi:hypothetical protein
MQNSLNLVNVMSFWEATPYSVMEDWQNFKLFNYVDYTIEIVLLA